MRVVLEKKGQKLHINGCVWWKRPAGQAGSLTQQLQEAIGEGSVLRKWFGMQSAQWSALKFPSISPYTRKYKNIDS